MPIAVCKRGDPSGIQGDVCSDSGAIFDTAMSDERIDAYDYALPRALIAQRPAERRDASRLMVCRRGSRIPEHRGFAELPDLLDDGDLLVVNDTRVIPARILAYKDSGGRVELVLLQPLGDCGDVWEALVRPSARVRPGTMVRTVRGNARVAVGEVLEGGHRRVDLPAGIPLESFGQPPLPPYIERAEGPRDEDWRRYQTVYARRDGAVAAPTAGLHFTNALLERLGERGIGIARVTLHVGAGTFEPVRVERLDEHAMHGERYTVGPDAVNAMERASENGNRVIAVGTTVVRTLEAWARDGRPAHGRECTTDLFLRPGDPFLAVDGMVTNFHLPRSTLLVLVSAFGGREWVLGSYREAVEQRYRFYSYGDAMLLL